MSTLLRSRSGRQSSNARLSASFSNINELLLDGARRDDEDATNNNHEIGLPPPPPYDDAQNYPNRDPHYYNDL